MRRWPTLAVVVGFLCYLDARIAAGQNANTAFLVNRPAVGEPLCNASTGCKSPPIGDLILGRQVYASNTCGQRGRQKYCSFVAADECKYCDSSSPDEKHTADLLTDSQVGKATEDWTWWQSEPGVEDVELRMDFGGVFHLSHVTITWKSVRPRCMAIERSVDFGRTWHPYQYFAQSCEECFGVQESFGPVPRDRRGNGTVLPPRCTTQYSAQQPTELGQVAFVPLDSLYLGERNDTYQPAVEHIRQLTNLRLRFTKLHTGDGGDVASMDPEDRRQYYFAIYNLIVKGNCFCNGHADLCGPTDRQLSSLIVPPEQIPVYSKCVCRHNAHGEDCGQCQPLYNDLLWRPGRQHQPNACRKCQCHGFAESCHFEEDRLAETSGQSGGVCDRCSHQRQGAQCDECVDQYYFQQTAAIDDSAACQLCTCLPAGAVPHLCHKAGAAAGQCICKANVQGEFCGQCKPGFYNLDAGNPDGCQECGCNANGTVGGSVGCHATTGRCQCKANAEGRFCDRCKDGSSPLSAEDPDGCGSCLCDAGGSLSSQCDPVTRQCPCRPNIEGVRCNRVPEGRYYSGLQRLNFYEAESGQLSRPARLATDGNASRGQWVQLPAGGSVELVISDIKWTMPYAVILNLGPMKLNGGSSGIKISIVADTSSTSTGAPSAAAGGSDADPGSITCRDQPDGTAGVTAVMAADIAGANQLATFDQKVCLRKGVTYRLIISREGEPGSSTPVFIDSASLLPTGSSMFRNVIDRFVLDGCSAVRSGDLATAQSDACARHEFAVSAILNNGTLACDCDAVGSTGTACSEYNGQCSCRPGVGGRRCDICQAYHYQFSNTGCTACNCSAFGSETPVCLAFIGQCPCLINTVGRTCAECRPDHYPAKDLALGIGCLPCTCNEVGSLDLACEASAGAAEGHQCHCKPGVTGALCDRCLAGFWNFGPRGCEPCACNPAGAVGSECDLLTGVCTAKANVVGAKADRCKAGHIHLQAENPDGCIRCFCNGQSDICRPSTLYRRAVVESSSSSVLTWGWNMSVGDSNLPARAAYLKPGDAVTFLAPANYLGDVRTAFSQSLAFSLDHNVSQLSAIITVSLERRLPPAHSLYYEIPMSVGSLDTSFEVRFLSLGWRLSSPTGPLAADMDLRQTLASLTALKISVYIPQDAEDKVGMVSLTSAAMTYAIKGDSPAGSGSLGPEVGSGSGSLSGSGDGAADSVSVATWVEECLCPVSYRGDHCEECAGGFTREPSYGTEFDMCLQCFDLCRQLSSEHCDVDSGECRGCTNHTAGAYCQQCLPHYFRRELMEGCLECPCPGDGLQFSDSCEFTGEGSNATCSCIGGHVGDNCEECAMGHHGMPVASGDRCQACSCNNNTDPDELDFCDRQTGECLDCLHDTGGAACGRCADGFYGDALRRTCRPCDCDQDGSNSSVCHYETGQCQCRPNTANRQCSECSPGHYGLAGGQGCKACNCCSSGSKHEQCDLISGLCPCLSGVGGRQCCACEDEFWDFPLADPDAIESPGLSGCKACNCSVGGSLTPVCDKASGACQCQPGSTGHKCSSCSVGTYGPPDCVHCGECFDNWNGTVVDVAAQIRDVGVRARLLREGGFADTYSVTFDAIRSELVFVKRYLDASYLNETLASAIEMEIAKLQTDIGELSRGIGVAENATAEESDRAASLSSRFQDLNATVLNDIEEKIDEIADVLQSYSRIPYVSQIAGQLARIASNGLKEQLDQPVADGGLLLSETIRQLGRINATMSSPAYNALYARNADALRDLDGRYLSMVESLAEMDRSICGSDSREGKDGCSASNSCGGLRCAVCATVSDSCRSAADNSSQAIGLAASTLAAVAERNQVIQALADSIVALAGDTSAADATVRGVVRDLPHLWKNASDLLKLAMAKRGHIEEVAGSASGLRQELLNGTASLKMQLTNPADTAAEMADIVADIRQRLSGIEDSEVEQIMTDTESSLASAKILYDNATAVNDEAHAALLIVLQLEVVLRQADAIRQDIVPLVRQLNTTASGIGETHSSASAALARIRDLTRDARTDLNRTLSLMKGVEVVYSETHSELSSIGSRQALLAQESSNVTQMVNALSSRSSEVQAILADNAALVHRRLAMAINMSDEAEALRREMDSFQKQAETVFNRTLQHRQTLDNIDNAMVTLLDDLDAAVASIERKDEYQTTCQFGQNVPTLAP